MIEITMPRGDRCDILNKTKNSPVYYQTIFEITCDPNIAKLAIDNPRDIKRTNCINVVKMRSKHGI